MPVLVANQEIAFSGTTTPRSFASITWLQGDLITIIAAGEGQSNVGSPTVSGLTFTATTDLNAATNCEVEFFQATAAADGSGAIALTGTATKHFGAELWQWRGHGGVGTIGTSQTGAATATVSMTVAEGSAVCGIWADFNAGAAGKTGTPTVNVEREDAQQSGSLTVWSADWLAQAAGTRSYGITSATSSKATLLFVEILEGPVIDRGSAHTTGGSSATNTLTSASFTPAVGSTLVVCTSGTWNLPTPALSVADTWGGTWTKKATTPKDYGGGYHSLCEIWTSPRTGTGAGTITVTRTAGTVDQFHFAEFLEAPATVGVGETGAVTSSGWTASQAVTLSHQPGKSSIIITCVDIGDIGASQLATIAVAPTGYSKINAYSENTWEVVASAYKKGSAAVSPAWGNTRSGPQGFVLACAVELLVGTESDDFNRANANLGLQWEDSGGGTSGWSVSSNKAVKVSGDDFAFNVTDLGSADMFVEADIADHTTGFIVLDVRATRGGGATCYMGFANPANHTYTIGKVVGGSYTDVGTPSGTSSTAVHLRLEVQGSTLRLYDFGVLKRTETDSSITTGHWAGMNAGTDAGTNAVDNWQAGLLVSGGPATVTAVILGDWGALTASVAAAVTHDVVVLGSWGGLTASVAAVPVHDVVALGAWGGLTASVAATPVHDVVALGAWGGLTSTVTAAPQHEAVATGDWGSLVATASADVTHAVTALGAWGGLDAQVVADVSTPGTAVLEGDWGGLTATATANVTHDVILVGSWGALVGTVVAAPQHAATALGDWGGLTAAATATPEHPVVAAGNWGGLTGTVIAVTSVQAVATATWGGLTAEAVATATTPGTVSAILLGNWGALVAHATAGPPDQPGQSSAVWNGPSAFVEWLSVYAYVVLGDSMSVPAVVGDLIDLTVTYRPPTGSVASVSAAELITRSPAGVEVRTPGTQLSTNVWRFTSPTRINEAGLWVVRVNANAGLIDSLEFVLDIARSRYDVPVP